MTVGFTPYGKSQNRTTQDGQKMALRLDLPGQGREASEISGTSEMDDGSRFSELRTQNFELRVALYASRTT